MPRIVADYEAGRFGSELIPELAKLGLLGANLEGYGCAGTSATLKLPSALPAVSAWAWMEEASAQRLPGGEIDDLDDALSVSYAFPSWLRWIDSLYFRTNLLLLTIAIGVG